jgi:O-antigen/teichoic acid export membrane protein
MSVLKYDHKRRPDFELEHGDVRSHYENVTVGKHFIERASWTLVDQCVASGGNFLLMVLLARSLSEEDYGEFALFLGVIFLLRTIDYSFISYPLSVRLCVANDDERARLLGNTVVPWL